MLAAGFAPALATFSTSCLCVGLREQMEWSLQPVLLRQEFFTKEIRRLLHEGENRLSAVARSEGGSQSPVLPWARLAYDACLNAGSTAGMENEHLGGTLANRCAPFGFKNRVGLVTLPLVLGLNLN